MNMNRYIALTLLVTLLFLAGCMKQTIVDVSDSAPTESIETIEETTPTTQEATIPKENTTIAPAKPVELTNSKAFRKIQSMYNRTVTRKDILSYSFDYFNDAVGRKGIATVIYGDSVRMDLYKENNYDPKTNIETITFRLGELMGSGYCLDYARCANVSKVQRVSIATYDFRLPPDIRRFRDGVILTSEYVKDLEVFKATATSLDDGKEYELHIDGGTGVPLLVIVENKTYEWDNLRVNQAKPEDTLVHV